MDLESRVKYSPTDCFVPLYSIRHLNQIRKEKDWYIKGHDLFIMGMIEMIKISIYGGIAAGYFK